MRNRNENQTRRMRERNQALRIFFNNLLEKNPQWRHSAVVEATADKFYLAEGTVEAIMNERPPYDDAPPTP